ncbi:hypothetical protein HQQ94_06450 [Shewanella sp. VB17]|uniref:hypothetical protein n=1 Tax=Shewanella sp. VB17 TaxID=2739432 RepID=UPI0015642937|nr:hypothetical protein [Shewanella sp. VB17]NRD72884.1 hypothetical protein [Shewanella sp. VB17]
MLRKAVAVLMILFFLSGCNSSDYRLNSTLLHNGNLVGPHQINLRIGETVDIPIKTESANILRLTLIENGEVVDVIGQLVYRMDDYRNSFSLPSITLVPDGTRVSTESQELELKIKWTISVSEL